MEEEEDSENETDDVINQVDAIDELGSVLMTDEFDNLGEAEVTVNRAPASINSIDPKEISTRKQDRNMPRPFALEKRESTEKSIALRFRPPTGNRDVFSHYQERKKIKIKE